MKKLGKEIRLGEKVEHVGAYITIKCTVVMNGRNKGYFTSTGFIKMKRKAEYKVVIQLLLCKK